MAMDKEREARLMAQLAELQRKHDGLVARLREPDGGDVEFGVGKDALRRIQAGAASIKHPRIARDIYCVSCRHVRRRAAGGGGVMASYIERDKAVYEAARFVGISADAADRFLKTLCMCGWQLRHNDVTADQPNYDYGEAMEYAKRMNLPTEFPL